ncbi:hypothetical protein BGZ73_004656 [Actinomortierella ambigua]|nr:hypothetical protein BGZ73_004656 [Actinomortierella ambigua]
MSVGTAKGDASGRTPSSEEVNEGETFTVVVQSPSTETLKGQAVLAPGATTASSKRSSSSSDKDARHNPQNSSAEARPASRTHHSHPPLPHRQSSSTDASGFSSGSSMAQKAKIEDVRQGHEGLSDPSDESQFQQGRVHTHKPHRKHSHQQLNHSRSFTRASSPSPTNEPSTSTRIGHTSLPVEYITQYSASMTDLRRQHQNRHPRKHGARLSAEADEEYPPRPASSASHHRSHRRRYARPSEDDDGIHSHASRHGSRGGWGDDSYQTGSDAYSIESYASRSLAGSSLSVADSYRKGQKAHQRDYGMGIVETHYWPEEDENRRRRHQQKVHQRHRGFRPDDQSDDEDEGGVAGLDIHDLEIAHHHQSMGMIPNAALRVPRIPSRPSSALSQASSQDQSLSRYWAAPERPEPRRTRRVSTDDPEDRKSIEDVPEKHRDKVVPMTLLEPNLEKTVKMPKKSQETKERASTTNRSGTPLPPTQEQQTTFSHTLVGGDTLSLADTERTADEHNYLAPLPPFQQGPAYVRRPQRGRCVCCNRRWWILTVVLVIAIVVVAILNPANADPVVYTIDPEVVQGLILRYDTETKGTVRIIDSANATETRVLLKLQRQFYKLKSDVDQQAVTGFQITTLPNGYIQYTLDDAANEHRQFFVSSVLCSDSILTIEMPRTKLGQRELALDARFSYQDVTVQLEESVYRNASWKITGTQNRGLTIQSLAVQSLDVVYTEQDSEAVLDLQSVNVAKYLTAASRGGLVTANIARYPSLLQQHSTNTSTPTTVAPSAAPTAAAAPAAAAPDTQPPIISISSLTGSASVRLWHWNMTTQFRVQGGTAAQLMRHGQAAGSPGALANTELTSTSTTPGSVTGSFQPSAAGAGVGAGPNSGLVAQVLVIAGDTGSLDFV